MKILKLSEHPELLDRAAVWFSAQWEIPVDIYQESIQTCIQHKFSVPQWYIVVDDRLHIVAGCGVIDHDFHDRKDLTPNLCALYVEESYRHQNIARQLLDFAKKEMQIIGVEQLYLITDLTDFYEKCGWAFLTFVTDDEGEQIRMYSIKTDE